MLEFKILQKIILICLCMCWATTPIAAQNNPFKTTVAVNGIGISHYEIDQRRRLLQAIRTPGDLQKQAEDALISEVLYLQEARQLDLSISEDEIESGISEFAARASLSAEQFLKEIAVFGVTKESFVAFVRAGVAWRKVITARFSSEVERMNILDVEKSLAFQPAPTFTLVRLSEIALSLRPSAAQRSREIAGQIHRTVTSAAEFADVAKSLSIAESKNEGGNIGWVSLSRMPSNIRSEIQITNNGRVTRPIEAQNAIFVFFKHGSREEVGNLSPEITDYSILRVARIEERTARQVARDVTARVDTCDDLRSVSREFPRGYFRHNSVKLGSEANRYSINLARLDANEVTIMPIPESDAVEVLMLCSRRASLPDEQRQPALNQKRNEKLEDYAENLLENLRASAIIIEF